MAQVDLVSSGDQIDTSWDDIIIQKLIEDIPGGRSLDVEGVDEEILKAGRVIIEEDDTGELKPLKIVDDAYDSLPSNHSYKGILYRTIPTDRALASIMVRGTMNEEAAKNWSLPEVPAGAKTALTLIRFIKE